jgi:hypothetical protein
MKRRATGISFDTERAEKLLVDWANLARLRFEDFLSAVARLRAKYPDVCEDEHGLALADGEWLSDEDAEIKWIMGVQNHLEAIWTAAAANKIDIAEQYIFRLRELYGRIANRSVAEKQREAFKAALRKGIRVGDDLIQIPEEDCDHLCLSDSPAIRKQFETGTWVSAPAPDTFFDRTMRHLKTELRRASICRNPDCPTPYFLREIRGQKYCKATGDCFHETRLRQQNARREAERGPAMRPGRPRKAQENQ